MNGFSLAARRGGYADDGARPPPRNGGRLRPCEGEVNFGPGNSKGLGERRPIIVQDYVRRASSLATDGSWCCGNGQRPNVFLHLSTRAESLVAKLQKERDQAAEGEPCEAASQGKP